MVTLQDPDIIQVNDAGEQINRGSSGLDINTFSVRINEEAVLTEAVTNGFDDPSTPLLSTTITVPLIEGRNFIEVSIADNVGNEHTQTFSIVRDQTAPQVTILSPNVGKKVALPAVVKVETFEDTDIGSGVAQVTVNGVIFVRQQLIGAANEAWIAAQVPVDVALKTIQVEATDTIGNVLTLAEVGVNVLEFGAYDTEESGLAQQM